MSDKFKEFMIDYLKFLGTLVLLCVVVGTFTTTFGLLSMYISLWFIPVGVLLFFTITPFVTYYIENR